jgi:hypothetical protein
MTSDGISDSDWQPVHDLAVEIVNAGESEEGDRLTTELLDYLNRLERKYGSLPSILATRADYVASDQESATLLERAYSLSRDRGDRLNSLYAASSLAALYIERLRDRTSARRWIAALREALKYAGDETDIEECDDLEQALDRMDTNE